MAKRYNMIRVESSTLKALKQRKANIEQALAEQNRNRKVKVSLGKTIDYSVKNRMQIIVRRGKIYLID